MGFPSGSRFSQRLPVETPGIASSPLFGFSSGFEGTPSPWSPFFRALGHHLGFCHPSSWSPELWQRQDLPDEDDRVDQDDEDSEEDSEEETPQEDRKATQKSPEKCPKSPKPYSLSPLQNPAAPGP